MLQMSAEQYIEMTNRLKELFEPFGFMVDGHMVAVMPFGLKRPVDCSCIPLGTIEEAMGALFKLVHDKGYELGKEAKRVEFAAQFNIVADMLKE